MGVSIGRLKTTVLGELQRLYLEKTGVNILIFKFGVFFLNSGGQHLLVKLMFYHKKG